jgi:hypothetical protein
MASWLFPWQLIYRSEVLGSLAGIIQFSWRFLIFGTFFLGILMAYVLEWCRENKVVLAVVLGLCIASSALIIGNGYIYENESVMENKYSQVSDNYLYNDYYSGGYNPKTFKHRGNIVTTNCSEEIQITNYRRNGTNLSFDFQIAGDEESLEQYTMTFPYYNYGFYEVDLDGKSIETFSDEDELLSAFMSGDRKSGHIEVKYVERKLYQLSNVVSFGTFLLCLLYLLYKRKSVILDKMK